MTNSEKSDAQKKSISMHDGVPVWYDCCSCEAEPYWEQAFIEGADTDGAAAKPDKAAD